MYSVYTSLAQEWLLQTVVPFSDVFALECFHIYYIVGDFVCVVYFESAISLPYMNHDKYLKIQTPSISISMGTIRFDRMALTLVFDPLIENFNQGCIF
jgi:hypothetical protein